MFFLWPSPKAEGHGHGATLLPGQSSSNEQTRTNMSVLACRHEQTCLKDIISVLSAKGIFSSWWAMGQCCVSPSLIRLAVGSYIDTY